MTSRSQLTHFDEVELVDSPKTRQLEIVGEVGVVVGVSENAGERHFAVAIWNLGRSVVVGAEDMRPTGRRLTREEIYDGSSLRVTDEGHAIDGLFPQEE